MGPLWQRGLTFGMRWSEAVYKFSGELCGGVDAPSRPVQVPVTAGQRRRFARAATRRAATAASSATASSGVGPCRRERGMPPLAGPAIRIALLQRGDQPLHRGAQPNRDEVSLARERERGPERDAHRDVRTARRSAPGVRASAVAGRPRGRRGRAGRRPPPRAATAPVFSARTVKEGSTPASGNTPMSAPDLSAETGGGIGLPARPGVRRESVAVAEGRCRGSGCETRNSSRESGRGGGRASRWSRRRGRTRG